MDKKALVKIIKPKLEAVYGDKAESVLTGLLELADKWTSKIDHAPKPKPDQATAFLITYGWAVGREGEKPLKTLKTTLDTHVGDAITDVHLLPVYPWTSDDGYSVVDHTQVDPALGTWEDIKALGADRNIMLDFVANHISASSEWFKGWLTGDKQFDNFFIERDPAFDESEVVRPRTSPLFHKYVRQNSETGEPQEVEAWTTFSPDQLDVNVANPKVFLALTDIMLGYIASGARTIRLDAIGFLWKESGTKSIHLPQTHALMQVWRALVENLAPGTLLITETNVPHADNITYFGDGENEAHMVYQFALPPLVLDAFVSGQANILGKWAAGIGPVSPTATWFNFLASHDGIGMRPSEGLLTEEARQALAARALAHGGRVSMATDAHGTERMYELNVSYLDALSEPGAPQAEVIARGLAAHSILASLVGVPAVYYHSLFGSTGDVAGMEESGIARRINRAHLDADQLAHELSEPGRRAEMLAGLRHLLEVRSQQPGFDPFASQAVSVIDDRALVVRRAAGTPDEIVAITNVSDQPVSLTGFSGTDVLTGQVLQDPVLPPYGYYWLHK